MRPPKELYPGLAQSEGSDVDAQGSVAIIALTPAISPAAAAPATVIRPSIQPSLAQTLAVKRALAADLGDIKPGQTGYGVATGDVNGDGRPDLFVLVQDVGFCGTPGCQRYLIVANASGYAGSAIKLASFFEQVTVLPTVHAGMKDLRFDANHMVFKWNGKAYR